MKPPQIQTKPDLSRQSFLWQVLLLMVSFFGVALQLSAAPVTTYSNDFESYTSVATSLADTSDADPTGAEWNIADDTALNPTTAGAGVQVIDWITNSAGGANKSLLLRPATEAQINLAGARTGTKYTFDFWTYAVREPTSDRNFYIVLRGEGSDYNGDDFLAYQVNRATNSTVLRYYDGVGPGGGAWVNTTANQTVNQWQHHRMVIDPNALTFNLYVDDMNTPVVTAGDLSRGEIPVPTQIRILNEGNSADDGYFAIDDISLTVEGSIDLSTTFTEGFESYPARVATTDDADPQGPWVTTEVDGANGAGKPRAPGKVQVVDSSVTAPHSGTKCLKIEGGQRAGVSLAWGTPPLSDVQITWWAKVPATDYSYAVSGQTEFNYLRMSLYGAENGNCYSGDNALLGYGIRSATVGTSNSLTYYTTGWVDSGVKFTPDAWTEYRLTTHTGQGKYTILKNPSSANPEVIADRQPMIGSASIWSPVFMAAWSSSNGTNHPPVYIDDIEIKSLVANAAPVPTPYNVEFDGTRFTNVTTMLLGGPIGAVAVDPRDNTTILFTEDALVGGKIRKATRIASGNWAVDPVPVVSNLSYPSGLTIAPDGTLWWVHDYSQALMRLKWPWSSNTPEQVISDFGVTNPDGTFLDDDPFDVRIAPPSFNGGLGHAGQVVVMDRGVDNNDANALILVDPATMELSQTNYQQYLVMPTTTGLGSAGNDLIGMTTLPATGEIVTFCLDGQISAVNGDGTIRAWWPTLYADPAVKIAPASIATDPLTGRLWIADDLMDQVWSIPADGPGTDTKELSFPLVNPLRPDWQMDFHEPGMTFSPDGKIMVLSDTSIANGGGRLLIFHNETFAVPPFSVTSGSKTAQGATLSWQSVGAVNYTVQRSSTLLSGSWTDIATNLATTTFTDTNAPAGAAFYRVQAKQQ